MAGAFGDSAFQNSGYQTDTTATTTPTPAKRGRRTSSQPILAQPVHGRGHLEFGFTLHGTGTVNDDDLALALL